METHWPELLALHLDLVEDLIRKELADPSTARSKRGKPIPGVYGANLRQLDLMQALEGIAAAREELARCPEGVHLAMLVSSVELHRLRLPVASERQRYQGGQKGAHAPKRKTKRSAIQRRARFKREAAALRKKNPKLSTKRIAELLARTSTLSAETIRRIVG